MKNVFRSFMAPVRLTLAGFGLCAVAARFVDSARRSLAGFILCSVAVLSMSSCSKEDTGSSYAGDLVGEWNLTKVETRSATVGGVSVDVYISFVSDYTFTLYQQIGEGRYRYYTGTWTLSGGVLSGGYDDGASWASSYTVEFQSDASTLLLTTSDGSETDSYTRTSIPSAVIEEAVEP